MFSLDQWNTYTLDEIEFATWIFIGIDVY
jgi:hypothetical protein